jgi:hypothetical protein
MGRRSAPLNGWRQLWLTLAMLAVGLKVLVPAGFMPDARSNALPFAVVLCTGQGMVTLQPGETLSRDGVPEKAPIQAPHQPCVFAGHGLAAPPPALLDHALADPVGFREPPPLRLIDLTPARVPTGPPLPARGPPALLV